jgi:3-hydroxy-D-aspartate aldolase
MEHLSCLRVAELETPALLIDLSVLERNIRIMSEFMRDKKAKLRPHFKSYKCPNISHMQIAAGAKGITCAKTSEAEVLANAGIRDILVANQIADPNKIYRLACMAKAGVKITVAVDRIENVMALSKIAKTTGSTLHVLLEVDVGMNRCGINTPEEALELARRVERSEGLAFEGLQAYEGHLVYDEETPTRLTDEVKRHGVRAMIAKVGRITKELERNGLAVREISGGGTGTYYITGDNTIWTEIQAGSYVFMDNVYSRANLPFANALTILTTVIHKRPGMAITDAGLKVCTTEQGPPTIKGNPNLKTAGQLSEEHGQIVDEQDELRFLQKIEYIPSHCCTAVNLHDRFYCVRDGILEAIWPVSARGRSQ